MCDYLENESEIVRDNQVNCWIKRMDEFVRRDSEGTKQLPLEPENEFNDYLFRFIEEDVDGIDAFRKQRLGFVEVEPTEEYPYSLKLQYCVIAALSIGDSRDPRELKLPIYEKWEEYLREFDETAPPGLQNVYQTASMWWSWMQSERAFFVSAVSGMAMAICFACVVIFIATRNWIITLFAIHCVGFICATEMAL